MKVKRFKLKYSSNTMAKRKRQIKTSKIKRGSLIRFALDNVKRGSFDTIKKELNKTLKTRRGIYALYKNGKVVKVGLSTGLYGRVKGHSKNENLDWDTASFFVIRHIKYLRDLETAVNRIAKPPHSKQLGRVADEHYLERLLRSSVKQKRKELKSEQRKSQEQAKKQARKLQKEISSITAVLKG